MKLSKKTYDSLMRGTAKKEKILEAIALANNEMLAWKQFKDHCYLLLKDLRR